jgi:hypothetical protein
MSTTTKFVYTDGGRAEAGFRGEAGDCVARAVAVVTGKSYKEVYQDIASFLADNGLPKSARNGVPKHLTKKYMASRGFSWTPTMRVGQGTTVHLRADELPSGRIVASVTRHLVAVLDGTIYDNHDPSRGGTRAVYGYWTHSG